MVKPKKCKWCKNEFTPQNSLAQVCSYECSIALARSNGLKKMEQITKEKRKEMKEKNKPLGDYKAELQVVINQIVRAIDYGQDCISSGRPFKDNDQAGHFYSRGAHGSIRFNLWNIHSQSIADNQYKSGNISGFTNGLINRYDMNLYQFIIDLPIHYRDLKLTKVDIIEATAKAKVIAKQIEKRKRTTEELIELRKQINKHIGIYD